MIHILWDLVLIFGFYVFHIGALIAGLIICIKHKFIAGILFFSLIILHGAYTWIFQYFAHPYLSGVLEPPFRMSIGVMLAWNTVVQKTIEVAAFIILLIGLYVRWGKLKPKEASHD